ncbi:MAG: hypothetical protein HY424_02365 [Candidatus Levybacteria bacterium]|nr:hypothetical protein [Candidatus Levybacteria bacterium]
MQKIFLLAFSFLIFLLSFSISLSTSKVAFAQKIAPPEETSINYELPYPGLLPDNPLYVLRVIRDRTVGFLISSSLKKAEFNLLQADKRLNAGIYLFNKNKIPLSFSTISKAENYFEEAIEKIKQARKEGMNITEIVNKLRDAAKKHEEVLISLGDRSPKNFKNNFESLRERVVEFQKEVRKLKSKT